MQGCIGRFMVLAAGRVEKKQKSLDLHPSFDHAASRLVKPQHVRM